MLQSLGHDSSLKLGMKNHIAGTFLHYYMLDGHILMIRLSHECRPQNEIPSRARNAHQNLKFTHISSFFCTERKKDRISSFNRGQVKARSLALSSEQGWSCLRGRRVVPRQHQPQHIKYLAVINYKLFVAITSVCPPLFNSSDYIITICVLSTIHSSHWTRAEPQSHWFILQQDPRRTNDPDCGVLFCGAHIS